MPIFGEGENEIAKHLFLFNYIFDFILCCATIYIINKLCDKFLYFRKNVSNK